MEDLPNAEMRCLKVSKGGMKYELLLPAEHDKLRKRVFPGTGSKTLSLLEIQKRLDEAEERRLYHRNSRVPSQHLSHIAEVRENRRRSISDFRNFVRKESEQRIKKSDVSREDRIKALQMRSRFERARPSTAPVKVTNPLFEMKSLEEHLKIQCQLLQDLNIQANQLMDTLNTFVQKSSS